MHLPWIGWAYNNNYYLYMLCQKKEIEDIINGQEVDEGNSYTCTVTGKCMSQKKIVHS